ncbi:MAG: septal ring lytic transglycosylase RlpA family protein [Steroidobacteraceae bacterium]
MNAARAPSISFAAAIAVGLGGCVSTRHAPPPPSTQAPAPAAPSAALPPPLPGTVPDAVPRYEPRSPYGNPPFYDVFGKRYFVLSSSADYVERGVASWYGPGFHQVRTSTREPYDMYGMTAAHKTLPLPCYARVTNLQNGRSIVVRINDRGPFVGNRIIDLSYTAAAKLDMLRNGTAMVEVRTVGPTSPSGVLPPLPPPAPPPVVTAQAQGAAPWVSGVAPLPASTPTPVGAPPAAPPGAPVVAPAPVTSAPVAALFVQAGAFADPANAERLAQKLRGGGYGKVFVRDDVIAGRRMYRVRIGPVPGVPEFDRIVAALEEVGVRDAHLALD